MNTAANQIPQDFTADIERLESQIGMTPRQSAMIHIQHAIGCRATGEYSDAKLHLQWALKYINRMPKSLMKGKAASACFTAMNRMRVRIAQQEA